MNVTEYQKAYRIAHKEKQKEYDRQRYLKHGETIRAKNRKKYHENKLARKAYRKRYYEQNKIVISERNAIYAKHHPEIAEKSLRNYKERYPDRIRASKKKYQDNHKPEMLSRVRKRRAILVGAVTDKAAVLFYKKVRMTEWATCYYCSRKIQSKLAHIDHIVALSKNGNHASDNLCVSCPDCNRSKSNKSLSEWSATTQRMLPI